MKRYNDAVPIKSWTLIPMDWISLSLCRQSDLETQKQTHNRSRLVRAHMLIATLLRVTLGRFLLFS